MKGFVFILILIFFALSFSDDQNNQMINPVDITNISPKD